MEKGFRGTAISISRHIRIPISGRPLIPGSRKAVAWQTVRPLLLLLLFLSTAAAAQEPVEGWWEGALVRDASVRLVRVEFFRDGDALKARVQNGDWLNNERIVAVTQNGATVTFDFEGATTLMHDAGAGELVGTSGKGTPPTRVHLKRAVSPVSVPLKWEDVRIGTIAGTLVTPASPGPHPAIVWIHGRGKSTRSGLRGLARIFAERGVASLIYDKRGVGESGGDHDAASLHDHAADVLAMLDHLVARKDIDRAQIGLRGNSAGGWVAAIVANRTKVPLAFIITTVGPAESVMDQQIHVATTTMRRSDLRFTAEELAAAEAHMTLVTRFAYTGKGWDELHASVARAKASRWARFVDLPESEQSEDILWVRLNQYDPAPDLKKIRTPFLALYGGDDYVTPPAENVAKMERYLTEAGNRDYKVVVIPGVGHGLSLPDGVRTLQGDSFYWLWAKYSPEALRLQLEWLLARVTVAGGARGRVRAAAAARPSN
jgi:pimeloyl-ACP methyl ester carboxylesterase